MWSTRFSLFAGAAVVAVVGALVVPPAARIATPSAHAADVGQTFFDKAIKKQSKTIAGKLWEIVEDAKKNNFWQFALEESERALLYFPDHRDAREFLHYEKKGGKWVRPPEEGAKVKKLNTKNAKESQQSYDKRVEKWKERKAKVDGYIATKIAKVGDACKSKGFGDQAEKAYLRALALDKNNAAARKGLGFQKVGKVWLSPKQIAAVKQATEGAWVQDKSALEKGLGISLNKMESPHFRVEDDKMKEALPEAIKQLEVLYAYYLADVGQDPTQDFFDGRKATFCVVSTQRLWEKWVDGFSNAPDKKWTKESNIYVDKKALNAGTLRVETAEHVDTRDPLLHHATHMLNHVVWDLSRSAWLDEGLSYYYTVKVQETTRTHCVAKTEIGNDYGKSEEIGGFKDWAISEFWREYLRQMVSKKEDLELRALVSRKLANLELQHTVKSWAVITWLMDKRRDDFLEYLEATKKADEKEEAKLLEDIFGATVEQLDEQWRTYALTAY